MSARIGLQGELIASSLLLSYGIDNDLAGKEGYDLIAWLGKKPIRVQVKATQKAYLDRNKNIARYNFQTNYGGNKTPISKKQCDLMMLVALDKRVALFLLPEKLATTKKIYENNMCSENEKKSFEEVIGKLRNVCTCENSTGFSHTLP